MFTIAIAAARATRRWRSSARALAEPAVRTAGLVVVTLLAVAAPAPAQEATPTETRSFSQLSAVLSVDDEIIVTRLNGERLRGRILAITPDELLLAPSQHLFRRLFSPPPSPHVITGDVARIQYVDSAVNGALVGALVGVGALAAVTAACGDECKGTGGLMGLAALVIVAPIVGIGVEIDRHSNRTVYRPADAATVRLGPLLRRDGIGASISVTF